MWARYRSSARRPAGAQPVLGARHPALERLGAHDVVRLLELARVHAEVAVGGVEQPLELVEGERLVHRQGAHDREAHALVDQPVQLQRPVTRRARRARPRGGGDPPPPSGSSRGARLDLATVPPGDQQTEDDVKPAEAGGHQRHCPRRAGPKSAATPRSMKQIPMTGTDPDRERSARSRPRCRRAAARCPAACAGRLRASATVRSAPTTSGGRKLSTNRRPD